MNRIVVGAHYGLKDWLAQRVTAVVMAVYVLFMIILLPMAVLVWFSFIRPAHRKRYRAAIAALPRWQLRPE